MDEVTTQSSPSKDDMNIAMLAHLLGIISGFLGALIIWLVKKDDSAFIADQSKEALNFQVTMLLAFVAAGMLSVILIGFLLMPLLWIANLIFCVLAAVSASKGENYRYPFALRLVK